MYAFKKLNGDNTKAVQKCTAFAFAGKEKGRETTVFVAQADKERYTISVWNIVRKNKKGKKEMI